MSDDRALTTYKDFYHWWFAYLSFTVDNSTGTLTPLGRRLARSCSLLRPAPGRAVSDALPCCAQVYGTRFRRGSRLTWTASVVLFTSILSLSGSSWRGPRPRRYAPLAVVVGHFCWPAAALLTVLSCHWPAQTMQTALSLQQGSGIWGGGPPNYIDLDGVYQASAAARGKHRTGLHWEPVARPLVPLVSSPCPLLCAHSSLAMRQVVRPAMASGNTTAQAVAKEVG